MDRALSTLYFGLITFGAGVVTIAQGVLDPTAITIERIIGGGILVTVAVLIVRWSRQMTISMRDTLNEALAKTQSTLDSTIAILEAERAAWTLERQDIRLERDSLRQELIETRSLLGEERRLRIALENLGLHDRRHAEGEIPEGDPPPQ